MKLRGAGLAWPRGLGRRNERRKGARGGGQGDERNDGKRADETGNATAVEGERREHQEILGSNILRADTQTYSLSLSLSRRCVRYIAVAGVASAVAAVATVSPFFSLDLPAFPVPLVARTTSSHCGRRLIYYVRESF